MGASYKLKVAQGYPPTINDDSVSELVRCCATEVVGPDNVVEPRQTLGGEDMSYLLQRTRGCYFAVGVGNEACPSVHNPKFDFNERVLAIGAETHCRTALELLK